MAIEAVGLLDRAPRACFLKLVAIAIDRQHLALRKHFQDIAIFRLRDPIGFRLEQRHQFSSGGGEMECRCRRERNNIGNQPRRCEQVTSDLDLEFGEFVDDQQVDLFGGETLSRDEQTRPRNAQHDVAIGDTLLISFDRQYVTAAEKFLRPLRNEVVGNDQRDVELPRALSG